jgi:hypothetical protein
VSVAPTGRTATGAVTGRPATGAGFATVLVLTVTLAVAVFVLVMAAVLLHSHPFTRGLGVFAGHVNQQNQHAKTDLYLLAWIVIAPLSLIAVPRLADRIAAGPDGSALGGLTATLAATLLGVLIAVRISHRLPWGDGLATVAVADGLWLVAAAVVLHRAARGRGGRWASIAAAPPAPARTMAIVWSVTAGLAFVALLCVTARSSLHPVPLGLGAVAVAAAAAAGSRWARAGLGRGARRSLDAVAVVLLALAVPNLVVFHASGALPNIYAPPGVIADQQNYLLGSANQLLGGGALLVNVPVSQYGVGLIDFLYGWFHLVGIGYGTAGLLDGILTALFYIAGYGVLRAAGVGPLLSAVALAVAVAVLIDGMLYGVGALPETGPLRFGLPMALVAVVVAGARWRAPRAASAAALVVLGISAIWAFEAFAYTVVTFAALTAGELWLARPAAPRRWLGRRLAAAVGACVAAHVLLAVATLLGTGRLPDWGQYLTYLHSFLLGGVAGAISYGFANWSPGLAVGVGALACAAAIVLLMRRAPAVARREAPRLLALIGLTAYTVALLSYVDNRSLTYLLDYVSLPLLLAAVLWLDLALAMRHELARAVRRGALVFAVAVAAVMVSAAWPAIGHNFSQSALAHAYPGGGARAAIDRLLHPPPIDPRAPVGVGLLDRYVPGTRALVVLPLEPDLGVEILMRARRANALFIGDPVDDSLVPSLWLTRLRGEVARLRVGQRLLIDSDTLLVAAGLRAHPSIDPVAAPIDGGNQELEWLVQAIDARFVMAPIVRGTAGMMVAQLVARGH